MKKVLFNVSFKDRYTGEMNKAGATAEMSEERIAEIKEVNPNFISVIGNVESAPVQGEPEVEPEGEPVAEEDETPTPPKKGKGKK